MSEKYLIVGATGSIGSSLAEQLYASEKEIHLVSRNVEETKSLSEKFNCSYTIADVLEEKFVDKIKSDIEEVNGIAIPFTSSISDFILSTNFSSKTSAIV